jgi:hypothetical protein
MHAWRWNCTGKNTDARPTEASCLVWLLVIRRFVAQFKFETRQKRFPSNYIIQDLLLASELAVDPEVLYAVSHHGLGTVLDNVAKGRQLAKRLFDCHPARWGRTAWANAIVDPLQDLIFGEGLSVDVVERAIAIQEWLAFDGVSQLLKLFQSVADMHL